MSHLVIDGLPAGVLQALDDRAAAKGTSRGVEAAAALLNGLAAGETSKPTKTKKTASSRRKAGAK